MERALFAAGAISGAIGVAAGAFGAHGLKGRLPPELLAAFETGARYQLVHAVAILAAAWAATRFGASAAWGGWLLVAGTVLFSGSLYLMALTGAHRLGLVTPVGGVAFIAGWIVLAVAGLRGAAG
jgi:uncharacterized membrane protein YgdD (TMEM256/DUF423 family)